MMHFTNNKKIENFQNKIVGATNSKELERVLEVILNEENKATIACYYDMHGRTMLMHLIENPHCSMEHIKRFLKNINLNQQELKEYINWQNFINCASALHYIIWLKLDNPQVLKDLFLLLLEYGANPKLTDNDSSTALLYIVKESPEALIHSIPDLIQSIADKYLLLINMKDFQQLYSLVSKPKLGVDILEKLYVHPQINREVIDFFLINNNKLSVMVDLCKRKVFSESFLIETITAYKDKLTEKETIAVVEQFFQNRPTLKQVFGCLFECFPELYAKTAQKYFTMEYNKKNQEYNTSLLTSLIKPGLDLEETKLEEIFKIECKKENPHKGLLITLLERGKVQNIEPEIKELFIKMSGDTEFRDKQLLIALLKSRQISNKELLSKVFKEECSQKLPNGELLIALLEATDIDPDSYLNSKNQTLIFYAVMINHEKLLDTLLKKGANVHHQDGNKNTVVHFLNSLLTSIQIKEYQGIGMLLKRHFEERLKLPEPLIIAKSSSLQECTKTKNNQFSQRKEEHPSSTKPLDVKELKHDLALFYNFLKKEIQNKNFICLQESNSFDVKLEQMLRVMLSSKTDDIKMIVLLCEQLKGAIALISEHRENKREEVNTKIKTAYNFGVRLKEQVLEIARDKNPKCSNAELFKEYKKSLEPVYDSIMCSGIAFLSDKKFLDPVYKKTDREWLDNMEIAQYLLPLLEDFFEHKLLLKKITKKKNNQKISPEQKEIESSFEKICYLLETIKRLREERPKEQDEEIQQYLNNRRERIFSYYSNFSVNQMVEKKLHNLFIRNQSSNEDCSQIRYYLGQLNKNIINFDFNSYHSILKFCSNDKKAIDLLENKDNYFIFIRASMAYFCKVTAHGLLGYIGEHFLKLWDAVLLRAKRTDKPTSFIKKYIQSMQDFDKDTINKIKAWNWSETLECEKEWSPYFNNLSITLLIHLISTRKKSLIKEDTDFLIKTLEKIVGNPEQRSKKNIAYSLAQRSDLTVENKKGIIRSLKQIIYACAAEESIKKDNKKIQQLIALCGLIKGIMQDTTFDDDNNIKELYEIYCQYVLKEIKKEDKGKKKKSKKITTTPLFEKDDFVSAIKNDTKESSTPAILYEEFDNKIEHYKKQILHDKALKKQLYTELFLEIEKELNQAIKKIKRKKNREKSCFAINLLQWHNNDLLFSQLEYESKILFETKCFSSEDGLHFTEDLIKLSSELQHRLESILESLKMIEEEVESLDENYPALKENNTSLLLPSIDRLRKKCKQFMKSLDGACFEIKPLEHLSDIEKIQNLEYFRHFQQKNPLIPHEMKESSIKSLNKTINQIASKLELSSQSETLFLQGSIEGNVFDVEQPQISSPVYGFTLSNSHQKEISTHPLPKQEKESIHSSNEPYFSFKTPLTLNTFYSFLDSFNDSKNYTVLPIDVLESQHQDINQEVKRFLTSDLGNTVLRTEDLRMLSFNFLLELYLYKETFLETSKQYKGIVLNDKNSKALQELQPEEIDLLKHLIDYGDHYVKISEGDTNAVYEELCFKVCDNKKPLNYFHIVSFLRALSSLAQHSQSIDLLKDCLNFLAEHHDSFKQNGFRAFEKIHILYFAYKALKDGIHCFNACTNKTLETAQELNESIQSIYFAFLPWQFEYNFSNTQLSHDIFWLRFQLQESLLNPPELLEGASIILSSSYQVKLPQFVYEFMGSITEKGYDCFVFGGSIRSLLKEDTVFDFDFITNMPPQEFQQWRTPEQRGVNIPSMEATYFKLFQWGMAFDVLCKNGSLNRESFKHAVFNEMVRQLDCTIHTAVCDSQGNVHFLDQRGAQDLEQGLIRLISSKVDPILRAIGLSTRPIAPERLEKGQKALTLSEESLTYIAKGFNRKTPLVYDPALLHALNKLFLYGNAAPSFVALYDYNLLECLFGLNETLLQQTLLDQPSLSFKEYLLQELKKIDGDFLNQKKHRIFEVLALLYRKATENYICQYPEATPESLATDIINNSPLLGAFTFNAREQLMNAFIEACHWLLKTEVFQGQQNLNIKIKPLSFTTTKKSSNEVKCSSNFFKNANSTVIENNKISSSKNKNFAKSSRPRLDKASFKQQKKLNGFSKKGSLNPKQFKKALNLYNSIINKNIIVHTTMLKLFLKCNPFDNEMFNQAWEFYQTIDYKDIFTHNTMLNLFSKLEPFVNEQFEEAWRFYQKLEDKDTVTHATMLNLFSKLEPLSERPFKQVYGIYENIKDNDKDIVTHTTMLKLFSKLEHLDKEHFKKACGLYENIKDNDKNIVTRSTMLNLFSKLESLGNEEFKEAWNLYNEINDKDIVTHSTMLNLFSKLEPFGNETFKQAWRFYKKLKDKNIFTHNTMLNLFSKLEPLGEEQFKRAFGLYQNTKDNDKDIVTHNTMLKLFAKLEPLDMEQFKQAFGLYQNIKDKNIVTHCAMLKIFAKLEPFGNEEFQEAWNLYNEINDKDIVTHTTMLRILAKNKAPDFGLALQIFKKVLKEIGSGSDSDSDKMKLYGFYLNILAKNQNPKEHDKQAFSLLTDIQSHLPNIKNDRIDLHPKSSPNGEIPFSYGIIYFWLKKELLELKNKDSFKTTIIHGKGDFILKQAIEEVMNIEEIKKYFSYLENNTNKGCCFIQSNSLEVNHSLSQLGNNSQSEIEGLTSYRGSFFSTSQKMNHSIQEERKTEDFNNPNKETVIQIDNLELEKIVTNESKQDIWQIIQNKSLSLEAIKKSLNESAEPVIRLQNKKDDPIDSMWHISKIKDLDTDVQEFIAIKTLDWLVEQWEKGNKQHYFGVIVYLRKNEFSVNTNWHNIEKIHNSIQDSIKFISDEISNCKKEISVLEKEIDLCTDRIQKSNDEREVVKDRRNSLTESVLGYYNKKTEYKNFLRHLEKFSKTINCNSKQPLILNNEPSLKTQTEISNTHAEKNNQSISLNLPDKRSDKNQLHERLKFYENEFFKHLKEWVRKRSAGKNIHHDILKIKNQSSNSSEITDYNDESVNEYYDFYSESIIEEAKNILLDDISWIAVKDNSSCKTLSIPLNDEKFLGKVICLIQLNDDSYDLAHGTFIVNNEDNKLTINKSQLQLNKGQYVTKIALSQSLRVPQRYYAVCKIKPDLPVIKPFITRQLSPWNEKKIKKNTDLRLNTNQQSLIQSFIASDEEGVFCMWGPPGTGKTATLAHLIKRLYQENKKIIICAATNKAVQVLAYKVLELIHPDNVAISGANDKIPCDLLNIYASNPFEYYMNNLNNLLEKLLLPIEFRGYITYESYAKEFIDNLNTIVTLLDQSKKKISNNLKNSIHTLLKIFKSEENLDKRTINKIQRMLENMTKSLYSIHSIHMLKETEQRILLSKRIICCTLSTSIKLSYLDADVVIIDEASQVPEKMVFPLFLFRPKKILLAGDPNQISPYTPLDKSSESDNGESVMFNFMKIPGQSCYTLHKQYRMVHPISLFPSHMFYNEILKTSGKITPPECFKSLNPYCLVDVNYGSEERGAGGSYINRQEADSITNFLEFMNNKYGDEFVTSLSIITFYTDQVTLLTSKLKDRPYFSKIRIATVDTFQGDQSNFIIVSGVRSNQNGDVGFLTDFRRFNVALTRAKYGLYVFANSRTLSEVKNIEFKPFQFFSGKVSNKETGNSSEHFLKSFIKDAILRDVYFKEQNVNDHFYESQQMNTQCNSSNSKN